VTSTQPREAGRGGSAAARSEPADARRRRGERCARKDADHELDGVSPIVMDSPDETRTGLRLAACPFCHTDSSVSHATLESAGEGWQCRRCGQRWDARRLATVGAYGAWASSHERAVLVP